MNAFQTNVDDLKTLFEFLTSTEQDTALAYLQSMHEDLQEIRLRSKIQEEAERSISFEAERIIFTRLAGQLVANMEYDFTDTSTNRLEEKSSNIDTDTSSGVFFDETPFDSCDLEPSTSTAEDTEAETEKLTCITCGYIANNRKALYRHGKRLDHATRPPCFQESIGLYACSLCNYRTERKFNLDRHLQRAHFPLRNHGCPHCDQWFKDKDSLKSHIRRIHPE